MDAYELASRLVPSVLDFLGKFAWPGVALYVLSKQKSAVGALFARLEELQLGSAKAKFGNEVERVAEKVEALEGEPVEVPLNLPTRPLAVPRQPQAVAPGPEVPVVQAPAPAPVPVPGVQLSGTGRAKSIGNATLTVGEKEPKSIHKQLVPWRVKRPFSDEKLRASGLIITEWNRLEDVLRQVSFESKLTFADSDSAMLLTERLRRHHFISFETSKIIRQLHGLRNEIAHSKLEPTKDSAETFAEMCRKTEARIFAEYEAWETKMRKLSDQALEVPDSVFARRASTVLGELDPKEG